MSAAGSCDGPAIAKAGPVVSRPEVTSLRPETCRHSASSSEGEIRMKRLGMIGLALAAAPVPGRPMREELTGTLKKIKETGAITIGYRDFVDSVFLSRRQPEADRLCDRHLLQDRRCREERAQARQARGQVQSGDVVDPDSIAGQRHHRPRMWIDHQQRRPSEAGCLYQYPFSDRDPFRLQEIQQAQLDRRSQGQVGGLDLRHHQHQAAHRSQRRPQSRHQHHSGQGTCRSRS